MKGILDNIIYRKAGRAFKQAMGATNIKGRKAQPVVIKMAEKFLLAAEKYWLMPVRAAANKSQPMNVEMILAPAFKMRVGMLLVLPSQTLVTDTRATSAMAKRIDLWSALNNGPLR